MKNLWLRNFATRRRQRRGYVLLVTLGLLVLSTTLLVAVGRSAADHVLQARLEQANLQRHWGTVSCRTAILQNAEQILVSHEQMERHAMPQYRADVQLGDDSFTLIVADEQAKANVNGMIDQFGKQGAEDRIRQALIGSGLVNLVRLRPASIDSDSATPATRPAGPPRVIFGPGQMFDSVGPEALMSPRAGSAPALQSLTCWGSGSINIMRADQSSMRLSMAPVLTQLEISRLIAARDAVVQIPITSHPGQSVTAAGNTDAIGALLAQAHIDTGRRNRLAMTSRSTCHSLSIIVRDGRRQWYSLSVSDESDLNRSIIQSVVW